MSLLFHTAVGLYGHSSLKAMIAISQPVSYFLSFLSVLSLVIIDFRLTQNIVVLL